MTTLRPATDADMNAVADLWHAGWHDAHPGHVPEGLTAARTLETFHERAVTRVPDTTVATAEDGSLLGFVMVVGDEVEQVYVGQAGRGTGVGVALLAQAEGQVAAGGHDEAWLAVVEGNARARRFYEKCGWRDGGDLPYEVSAGGQTFISPCRRYVTAVDPGSLVPRLERVRLAALVARDAQTAERLHADDYELISPDGLARPKADYLADVMARRLEYVTFEPDGEVAVRATPDLVVLRYVAHIRIAVGEPGAAEVVDFRARHTDHWERRAGGWQAVWSQATAIRE